MSIHKHKTARMSHRLEQMIHDIKPLTNKVDSGHWGELDNKDKKLLVSTTRKIRTLNHKINHLINDYYGT